MNNIWTFIFRLSVSVVIVVTAIGVLYTFVPELNMTLVKK